MEGIALDDFVAQRGILHVDYIKRNIEGAERLAILGMDEVARITDHICISPDFGGSTPRFAGSAPPVDLGELWIKSGFRVSM